MTVALGISAFYHDSAAALVRDGDIVAAAQEERFTRKKHDANFPVNALRYCVQEAGVAWTDIDFVTFYEGVNDAAIVNPPTDAFSRRIQWLAERVLTVQLLTYLFPVESGTAEHMWSDEVAAARSSVFLENVEKLRSKCAARGITFIVATQQVKSGILPAEKMRGVTYAEELALIDAARKKREVGPGATGVAVTDLQKMSSWLDPARVFTVHAHLMADMLVWANEKKVPVADVRTALDERRDLLVSWVHLHPDANRIVAETLADAILAQARAAHPAVAAGPRAALP